MTINITEEQQSVLVLMDGELDTPESIKIQPYMDKLLMLATKDIVLDCSKLSYIASAGLRQFLLLSKEAGSHNKKVILRNLNDYVLGTFQNTHTDMMFTIE